MALNSASFQIVKVSDLSSIPTSFPEHVCYYTEDTDKYYIYKDLAIIEIFNSSGLPAHVEYDETEKTLWTNGQSNITTNLSYGENALSSIFSSPGEPYSKYNTAIGYNALTSNTIGYMNTAIGCEALPKNTTGVLNVAVGYESLFENTTGFRNISVGHGALYNNTTGTKNVAIGAESLSSNFTGFENTAVGDGIWNGQTGSRNVLIGFQAAANNFNECIVLGRSAAATDSNQFVVGSTSYNAGEVTTEALTITKAWKVKINGVDYKIPLQLA